MSLHPRKDHGSIPEDLHPPRLPYLPRNAPTILRDATVAVVDPSRILVQHEYVRRRGFHSLVRCYVAQLREGCREPTCKTPTCFTNRKRTSAAPARQFTVVSARAIACHLATESDPEGALCPHIRAISPGDQDDGLQATELARADGAEPGPTSYSKCEKTESTSYGRGPALKEHHKTDPKSFTQRLFDTAAMRLLGWVPHRPPVPDKPDAMFEGQHLSEPAAHEPPGLQTADAQDLPHRDHSLSALEDTLGICQDSYEDVQDREPRANGDRKQRGDSWNGANMPNLRNAPQSSLVQAENRTKETLSGGKPSTSRSQSGLKKRDARDISSAVELPQTLSFLSTPLIQSLIEVMDGPNDVLMDQLPMAQQYLLSSLGLDAHYLSETKRLLSSSRQDFEVFADQSVFYVLSNPACMLKSFVIPDASDSRRGIRTEFFGLETSYRCLVQRKQTLVLHSLWWGLDALFEPPPASISHRGTRPKAASGQSSRRRDQETYLSDLEASHVITLSVHALMAILPRATEEAGMGIQELRNYGVVGPDTNLSVDDTVLSRLLREMMEGLDVLEDEMALRLTRRLSRVIVARLFFDKSPDPEASQENKSRSSSIAEGLIESLMEHRTEFFVSLGAENPAELRPVPPGWSKAAKMVEWLRGVISHDWDGKWEMSRFSAIGSAITILGILHQNIDCLDLSPEAFYMYFISRVIDPMSVPLEWQPLQGGSKTVHLLGCPFLFPPETLVTFSRAINFKKMSASFQDAIVTHKLIVKMSPLDPANNFEDRFMGRLRIAACPYLVLKVRRDSVLKDALDSLWRRERRELMRPLKVRLGQDEGEEGVDHGGVQQELFRIAIEEAMRPDYGLFTVDPQNRMTWFRPCSREPAYKFELIGLMVSLALYNGVTLPLNFPMALYRRLLGLPVVGIHHIRDGWPDLSKGLAQLIDWKDGDVGDVFMRTYEFSIDDLGTRVDIDMEKVDEDDRVAALKDVKGKRRANGVQLAVEMASLSADQDPARQKSKLVTNCNRRQYVQDYVSWLTDKSIRPQYEAFSRGFFACFEKNELSIFTPEGLQRMIEGVKEIDVEMLKRTARYEDGFSADHRLIKSFWEIIREYPSEQKKALLEFVTASDRAPVNGIGSILFVIQKNGPDSERLPTSLTCFGRLLLPEYSTKDKLREKLRLALENGKGFGVP